MLSIPNKSWSILFGAGIKTSMKKGSFDFIENTFNCRSYWPILNSALSKSWLQIRSKFAVSSQIEEIFKSKQDVKPETSKLSWIYILLIIVNHWFAGSWALGALKLYMMMNIKLKFQRTVLVRICQFSKQLVVNNFRIGLSDVELAKNPPNTVISESCPFGAC